MIVEEQRQLHINTQVNMEMSAERPSDVHLLDDDDDDLLMVDPDAEILKNLAQSNHTRDSDAFAESIDYDFSDDMTEIETQSIITNSSEPVESIISRIQLQDTIEPKPTITDFNYPFKLRGHSLVTIDQLLAVEGAALRGGFFFVKADIYHIYEKLQITPEEKIWNVGVVLRDSSAGMLKVNISYCCLISIFLRYIGVCFI